MNTLARLILASLLSLGTMSAQGVSEQTLSEHRMASTTESLSQSVILTDGSNWTLVPRGSLIHIPQDQQEKIGKRPIGNLLPWKKFVSLNHSWISAEEVTLRQAEGVHPIDPRRRAYWPKQDKVMVAVFDEAPITVAASANQTARN